LPIREVTRRPVSQRIDELAVWLLPGMSPRTWVGVRARGGARAVLDDPGAFGDLLSAPAAQAVEGGAALERAQQEQLRIAAGGFRLVHHGDDDFPALLREIVDPPPFLFVRGDLACLGEPAVAVVGARAASVPGRSFAQRLARDLAEAGVCVVSGLARGIDGCAHEGALAAGRPTVAVLGSGLDRIYPPEHEDLARRIVAGEGAILSELPLGAEPLSRHFPWRNRIIVGCSRAVVVVEAGARSGALTTARLALEGGRDVMAVPGHPAYAGARGSNGLIRDGAPLVSDAADVLSELGLEVPKKRGRCRRAVQDPVLELLAPGVPLTIDELGNRAALSVPALLARLTELEMEQKVRRLPGASFVRV
jgi:DNA processing protein